MHALFPVLDLIGVRLLSRSRHVCCSLIGPPSVAPFQCSLSSTAIGVTILAAATAVTSPCGRGKGGAKSHRKVKSCSSEQGDQRSPTILVTAKVVNVKNTYSSRAGSSSALDSCERLEPEPEFRERVGIGS